MAEPQLIATAVPILQVHPDPQQPRRLLPPDLAEALASGASPHEVLSQLRVRSERIKWIRERLAKLDGLADSIATDGLIQPIRVFQDGPDTYRIESGERRWWAHHIMVGRGDRRFERILAFIVGEQAQVSGVLRRRVAENVHRSDFTSIELARAMAVRAEEIASEDANLSRRDVEQRVGKENGMSDRRVRQFLALLKLPTDVQELAHQARLSESSLRALVTIKDPSRQLAAINALLHPVPKPAHTKTGSARRNESEGSKKSAPKRSVTSQETNGIRDLVTLAKKLQARKSESFRGELRRSLLKSEPMRKAILHLRETLDTALAGAGCGSEEQSH